jgi:formate hydrogenlyase subunit 4
MGARAINAVLGLWLFVSVFLWPHSRPQTITATVVGMLVVTAALAGLGGVRWARLVSAGAGGWLLLSALLLPIVSTATFWNHVVVGLAVGALGVSQDLRTFRHRRPVEL